MFAAIPPMITAACCSHGRLDTRSGFTSLLICGGILTKPPKGNARRENCTLLSSESLLLLLLLLAEMDDDEDADDDDEDEDEDEDDEDFDLVGIVSLVEKREGPTPMENSSTDIPCSTAAAKCPASCKATVLAIAATASNVLSPAAWTAVLR